MARGGLRGLRNTRVRRPRATRVRPRTRFGVPVRGLRGVNRRVRTGVMGAGGNRPSLGNKIQRFQSLNGSLTMSKCNILSNRANRSVALMKRVGTADYLTGQFPYRQDAPYGFQEVNSFGLLRQEDILSLVQLPTYMPGTTNNIPTRILLEGFTASLTCANASTAPVELDIYDIGLKRDIPSQVAIKGTQNPSAPTPYIYEAGQNPTNFWAVGSQMANNLAPIAGGVGGAYRNIASSPLDSPLFRDYFYIKKRTHVMLSQGGVHRHVLTGSVNRVLDSTLWAQFPYTAPTTGCVSNYTDAFKGITTFVMVVQKGLPVSDATLASSVTTSDTHVDFILNYRYKWSYVIDNSHSVYNGDSLTSPSSGQIINPGNGLAEPITYTV